MFCKILCLGCSCTLQVPFVGYISWLGSIFFLVLNIFGRLSIIYGVDLLILLALFIPFASNILISSGKLMCSRCLAISMPFILKFLFLRPSCSRLLRCWL